MELDSYKKVAGGVFAAAIIVFTLLAILSIWEVLSEEVSQKSLQTLGVILLASLISLIVLRIVDSKQDNSSE